jgi:aldose 1-epimerase
MSVVAPSGEQFELAFDHQRAVVTQVGAGLRTYWAGDREIIDGYDVRELCPSGRGQVLIPWPNRIMGGRYEFRGRPLELAIDEHVTHSAIHGLVRWAAWRVAEREDHRVALVHDLHPQPGYPFALALRIEYTLSERGLSVATTATNVGSDPCPYGAGAHPYLNGGSVPVDTSILRLPARSVLEVGTRGVPIGRRSVDGTPFDFRSPRPVGETMLDHCFTDLERDGDGLVRVALTGGAEDTGVTLWADAAYPYLMLYTGDDRPDVARRSLAVEPMTCPPHAFLSGEGIVVLEPGASAAAAWGLAAA